MSDREKIIHVLREFVPLSALSQTSFKECAEAILAALDRQQKKLKVKCICEKTSYGMILDRKCSVHGGFPKYLNG